MNNMTKTTDIHSDDYVIIWDDCTFCSGLELEEMSYMSDDFTAIKIDAIPEGMETEEFVENFVNFQNFQEGLECK